MEELINTMEANQIFMGNKPLSNYIRSAEILLREKGFAEIIIRARGKNIGRAVDLAELLKKKICSDLNIENEVAIFTEQFESAGRIVSISVIEIKLKCA